MDSKFMLIAQAPGENEDKNGVMFIGPSGKIFDELLANAEINREDLYITNLIKCMLPNCRKPKSDEIEVCSKYLDEEITILNPDILVPLGFYSSKYIFDRYSLPNLAKSEFHEVVGKLFIADNKKIFPLAHPATLLYHESFKEKTIKNYRKLKVLSEECKWFHLCPMKRYYEEGKLDKKWIELYCKGDWESCVRYYLEENGEFHPDNMLPDGTIDEKLKALI